MVGDLPAGLVGPSLPGVGLEALPLLFGGAAGIALVAFAEAIGPANEFAQKHGGRIDPNRELVALGAANAGAGLFSGFPIGSSLSKSAANDRAGAQTPASLVTAAAATALVALFLTPLFEPLPEATLGAVVVVAVSGMMKVGKMRRLWELRRVDFWLAMIALVGVLCVETLVALGLAVVISLGADDLAGERGAPDVPRPRPGRPGAGRPGTPSRRGDPRPAHRPARRDALLRQRPVGSRRGRPGGRRDASRRPTVVLLDLSLTPEVDVPARRGAGEPAPAPGRGRDRPVAVPRPPGGPGAARTRRRARGHRAGPCPPAGGRRGPGVRARDTPEARDRVAVLTDLLAYLRERRTQPGTSPEGVELLAVLEERLAEELAAGVGDRTDAVGAIGRRRGTIGRRGRAVALSAPARRLGGRRRDRQVREGGTDVIGPAFWISARLASGYRVAGRVPRVTESWLV